MGRAWYQHRSAKATSFYKWITSFYFIFPFAITKLFIDLTFSITQLLQGPAIDIADSTHRIESLKNLISCKHNTVNTFHNKCDILALACEMGIEECKTRTFKLQGNHNNVLSESTSDYFEKVVTIPLLDHLTVEIEKTFGRASISVYGGFVIISLKVVSLVYKNVNCKEKFSLFADLFKVNFPFPKGLEVEL